MTLRRIPAPSGYYVMSLCLHELETMVKYAAGELVNENYKR